MTIILIIISVIVLSFAVIFAIGLCRMAADEWDNDLDGNNPYSCNGGLTDEEIANLTKEDK
jgi:hypothetical protein